MKKNLFSIKIFIPFVALLLLLILSCENQTQRGNEKGEVFVPDSCDCDDLILDEPFNHYHYHKMERTETYTGQCTHLYEENGNIKMTKNIVDGKIVGLVQEFYPEGGLKAEYLFNEDHVYEDVKRFFPSGNIKYHASYKYGQIKEIHINLLEDIKNENFY